MPEAGGAPAGGLNAGSIYVDVRLDTSEVEKDLQKLSSLLDSFAKKAIPIDITKSISEQLEKLTKGIKIPVELEITNTNILDELSKKKITVPVTLETKEVQKQISEATTGKTKVSTGKAEPSGIGIAPPGITPDLSAQFKDILTPGPPSQYKEILSNIKNTTETGITRFIDKSFEQVLNEINTLSLGQIGIGNIQRYFKGITGKDLFESLNLEKNLNLQDRLTLYFNEIAKSLNLNMRSVLSRKQWKELTPQIENALKSIQPPGEDIAEFTKTFSETLNKVGYEVFRRYKGNFKKYTSDIKEFTKIEPKIEPTIEIKKPIEQVAEVTQQSIGNETKKLAENIGDILGIESKEVEKIMQSIEPAVKDVQPAAENLANQTVQMTNEVGKVLESNAKDIQETGKNVSKRAKKGFKENEIIPTAGGGKGTAPPYNANDLVDMLAGEKNLPKITYDLEIRYDQNNLENLHTLFTSINEDLTKIGLQQDWQDIIQALGGEAGAAEKLSTSLNDIKTSAGSLRVTFKNLSAAPKQIGGGMQTFLAKVLGVLKALNKEGINVYTDLGKQFDNLGFRLTRSAARFSFILAPVLGIYKKSTEAIVPFEYALSRATAAGQLSEKQYNEMKSEILDLSAAYGISSQTLAELSYQILSSGVSFDELNESMETAAMLAVRSGQDIQDLGYRLLILKDLFLDSGLSVKEFGSLLINATDMSKAEIGPLTQSLSRFGGAIEAFQVPPEIAVTLPSMLSDIGLRGERAGTTLNSAFFDFYNILEKLGIPIKDAEGNMRNFYDLAEEFLMVSQSFGYTDIRGALNAFGASAQSMKIFNVLFSQGIDRLREFSTAIQDTTRSQEAFEGIMETPARKYTRLMEDMKNFWVETGAVILEGVKPILSVFSSILKGISNVINFLGPLGKHIVTVIGVVTTLATAFGFVGLTMGQAAEGLGTLFTMIGLSKTALGGLSNSLRKVNTDLTATSIATASATGGLKGLTAGLKLTGAGIGSIILKFSSWVGIILTVIGGIAALVNYLKQLKKTSDDVSDSLDKALEPLRKDIESQINLDLSLNTTGEVLGKELGESAGKATAEGIIPYLKSASPPKVGPLKNIDKWGFNMGLSLGKSLALGVASRLNNIEKQFNTLYARIRRYPSEVPFPKLEKGITPKELEDYFKTTKLEYRGRPWIPERQEIDLGLEKLELDKNIVYLYKTEVELIDTLKQNISAVKDATEATKGQIAEGKTKPEKGIPEGGGGYILNKPIIPPPIPWISGPTLEAEPVLTEEAVIEQIKEILQSEIKLPILEDLRSYLTRRVPETASETVPSFVPELQKLNVFLDTLVQINPDIVKGLEPLPELVLALNDLKETLKETQISVSPVPAWIPESISQIEKLQLTLNTAQPSLEVPVTPEVTGKVTPDILPAKLILDLTGKTVQVISTVDEQKQPEPDILPATLTLDISKESVQVLSEVLKDKEPSPDLKPLTLKLDLSTETVEVYSEVGEEKEKQPSIDVLPALLTLDLSNRTVLVQSAVDKEKEPKPDLVPLTLDLDLKGQKVRVVPKVDDDKKPEPVIGTAPLSLDLRGETVTVKPSVPEGKKPKPETLPAEVEIDLTGQTVPVQTKVKEGTKPEPVIIPAEVEIDLTGQTVPVQTKVKEGTKPEPVIIPPVETMPVKPEPVTIPEEISQGTLETVVDFMKGWVESIKKAWEAKQRSVPEESIAFLETEAAWSVIAILAGTIDHLHNVLTNKEVTFSDKDIEKIQSQVNTAVNDTLTKVVKSANSEIQKLNPSISESHGKAQLGVLNAQAETLYDKVVDQGKRAGNLNPGVSSKTGASGRETVNSAVTNLYNAIVNKAVEEANKAVPKVKTEPSKGTTPSKAPSQPEIDILELKDFLGYLDMFNMLGITAQMTTQELNEYNKAIEKRTKELQTLGTPPELAKNLARTEVQLKMIQEFQGKALTGQTPLPRGKQQSTLDRILSEGKLPQTTISGAGMVTALIMLIWTLLKSSSGLPPAGLPGGIPGGMRNGINFGGIPQVTPGVSYASAQPYIAKNANIIQPTKVELYPEVADVINRLSGQVFTESMRNLVKENLELLQSSNYEVLNINENWADWLSLGLRGKTGGEILEFPNPQNLPATGTYGYSGISYGAGKNGKILSDGIVNQLRPQMMNELYGQNMVLNADNVMLNAKNLVGYTDYLTGSNQTGYRTISDTGWGFGNFNIRNIMGFPERLEELSKKEQKRAEAGLYKGFLMFLNESFGVFESKLIEMEAGNISKAFLPFSNLIINNYNAVEAEKIRLLEMQKGRKEITAEDYAKGMMKVQEEYVNSYLSPLVNEIISSLTNKPFTAIELPSTLEDAIPKAAIEIINAIIKELPKVVEEPEKYPELVKFIEAMEYNPQELANALNNNIAQATIDLSTFIGKYLEKNIPIMSDILADIKATKEEIEKLPKEPIGKILERISNIPTERFKIEIKEPEKTFEYEFKVPGMGEQAQALSEMTDISADIKKNILEWAKNWDTRIANQYNLYNEGIDKFENATNLYNKGRISEEEYNKKISGIIEKYFNTDVDTLYQELIDERNEIKKANSASASQIQALQELIQKQEITKAEIEEPYKGLDLLKSLGNILSKTEPDILFPTGFDQIVETLRSKLGLTGKALDGFNAAMAIARKTLEAQGIDLAKVTWSYLLSEASPLWNNKEVLDAMGKIYNDVIDAAIKAIEAKIEELKKSGEARSEKLKILNVAIEELESLKTSTEGIRKAAEKGKEERAEAERRAWAQYTIALKDSIRKGIQSMFQLDFKSGIMQIWDTFRQYFIDKIAVTANKVLDSLDWGALFGVETKDKMTNRVSMSNPESMFDKISKAITEASKIPGNFWNTATTGLKNLVGGIKSGLEEALPSLASFISPLLDGFSELGVMISLILQILSPLVEVLGEFIQSIIDLVLVMSGIKPVLDILVGALNVLNTVIGGITKVIELPFKVFSDFMNKMFTGRLNFMIERLTHVLETLYSKLGTPFFKMLDEIFSLLTNTFINTLAGVYPALLLFSKLLVLTLKPLEGFIYAVYEISSKAIDSMIAAFSAIRGAITALNNWMWRHLRWAPFGAVIDFTTKIINDLSDFADDLTDATDFADSVADSLSETAQQLTNVPEGFKVALAEFEAMLPEKPSPWGGYKEEYGTNSETNYEIYIGPVSITSDNPKEIWEQLKELIMREKFVRTGAVNTPF